MTTTPRHRRAGPGLALLLLLPLCAWPEAAPEGTVRSAAAPDPEASPPRVCYQAARDGGRDAYACDLAVQMARDAGDAAALAAALANRSLVLAAAGRVQPALGDLDEALAQAPGNADLHGMRGNLLLRLGRASEALAAHDRAIELTPDDPVAYYNRAFSYRALGEPHRAARDVEAARVLHTGTGAVRAGRTPGAAARPDR